ncbi:obg-like ATPase 1 [Patella vulgata]|uniref:obg-like ATPase 1 n=1 Tax=Patella vulgata TaxID=6465 RepID=UPI002180639B|nr:obg-like ATPase 1 [Patella vulgata]
MPPKKKEAEGPPPLIGRVGTSLKIGIVGLPNVGKSTFFNVLTKSQASAENFPFCTIEPNESRVPVPDTRFDFLCEYYQPLSKVPAHLNVVDIAGLVQGAHEGKGLGNAFLSNIKACDAIFHVTRAFDDEDIIHVDGEVNPVRDLQTIHDELRLKDLDYCQKQLEPLEKSVAREGKTGDKKKKIEHDCLIKVRDVLQDNKWLRNVTWSVNEIDVLNTHLFITSKPVIYLVNLSIKDYVRKKNKWLVKIKEWIDKNDKCALLIPFSGALELDLADMQTQEEKDAKLKELGTTSALEKIIVNGYKALNLIYFFTSGKDEVKAWTIQVGTKAPGAAGKIHTDFEKGFIMAEVMSFTDFKEYGNEAAVKNAGKYKQKGKEYVVEDGDIIFFKFNAGAGLTAAKKK